LVHFWRDKETGLWQRGWVPRVSTRRTPAAH
jgi:hypothetical protein